MRKSMRSVAIITALAMVLTMIPMISFGASKPGKANITSITQVTSSSATVKWKSVSGAKGYAVYRATSKAGTYKKVKTTKSKTFTNKSLVTGKTYWYKVKAYKLSGSKKIYGVYSAAKSLYVQPMLTVSKVNVASDGTLTFNINVPKTNKTSYINTNISNDMVEGKTFTAFIMPGLLSSPDTYDQSKAATYEFVSVKDIDSGAVTQNFDNLEVIILHPGGSGEMTCKYVEGSTAPAGFNETEDAFAFYLTYDDVLYLLTYANGSIYVQPYK